MNEKLQEVLAELITLTTQGKDFVLEQAPDVITQLLAWNFTISLLWFCAGVILILSALAVSRMVYMGNARDSDGDQVYAIVCCVFATCLGITSVIHNLSWLQIVIAPKVYLLDYASGLIK